MILPGAAAKPRGVARAVQMEAGNDSETNAAAAEAEGKHLCD